MEKRMREIVALVLLLVLGLGAVVAMGWYILVGHNWNIAAVHIDDYVGEMEGYSVVVYKGVVQKPADASQSAASSTSSASSSAVSATHGTADAGTTPIQQESSTPAEDQSAPSVTAETTTASEAPVSSESTATPTATNAQIQSSAAAQDTVAPEDDENVEEVAVLDVSIIADDYRNKDASVITLNLGDANRYDDPVILLCGDQRFGVFSIEGPYEFARIQTTIAYFKMHGVNRIIAISKDRHLKKIQLQGIDLVVFTIDAGIEAGGSYEGNVFEVDSPYSDEVQVVIVAPNNMMTSKTLTAD